MVKAYADVGAQTLQLPANPLAVRHPAIAWRSIRSLTRFARSSNASCIFTSQVSYASLLAIAGRLAGLSTAIHLGLAYEFPSPLFGWAMRRVTFGIAPSAHTAASWKQRGWPEKRLQVIANGVDTTVFHPGIDRVQAKAAFQPTGKSSSLIAYVGRIVEAKGVRTLLRAFASWHKQTNCGHLLFVGHAEKSELSVLQKIAAEHSLPMDAWSVRPPTNRPELAYRAADLVVVPSEWDEPFGLAPLEAMACGTLAVVSDRGILPQFVSPLGTACVFHSGDATNLAERIQYWMEDSQRRESAASQLTQFVREQYPFSHCGDAYLDTLGFTPQAPQLLNR